MISPSFCTVNEPGLKWNNQSAFLLRFLRVRKYNVEAALKSIKKYYRTGSSWGKNNLDLRPSTVVPDCREITAVLPHRDAQGRQILLIRSGVWNPAVVPQIDVHRAFLLCLKHLERSPSGQTAGIVIIIDYEGFGIEHAINCKLSLMKELTDFAQESMPLRLRAVHVIRESRGFDFCFALVRPFLKSKIIQRVYIVGGVTGQQVLNTAEFYDPKVDVWTYIRAMTVPRSGARVINYQDNVYVLGGFNGTNWLSSGEKYDPRREHWLELPSMLTPRSHFAVAVLDDLLFAIGGYNGTTTMPFVECYDPNTNAWQKVCDMNTNRSALGACVVVNLVNSREFSVVGNAGAKK
ncbi:alpha-tocopherol transfer protein isoform X2 [Rhipicephalus microplus]|uniref:alpha-tocopherol transfer protein isoform X2 n=1 Tax=Rhipicephalus microplus TaxID=6941 RepID=UPI003F6CE903